MLKRHTGDIENVPINVEDEGLENLLVEDLMEAAAKDGVFDDIDFEEEDMDTDDSDSSDGENDTDSDDTESSDNINVSRALDSDSNNEKEGESLVECMFCSKQLHSAEKVKLHMFEHHMDDLLDPS